MNTHLSALELDEIASGLAPKVPHLAECETCSARLKSFEENALAFGARPQAQILRERLVAKATSTGRRRRLALILVPLAAALALFFVPQLRNENQSQSRIKGAPTVALLNAKGVSVRDAAPGEQLTLSVGGAGFRFARVVVTESDGTTAQVWPIEGKHYGRLPQGASASLRELVVTPGDVVVTASFANEELELSAKAAHTVELRLHVR